MKDFKNYIGDRVKLTTSGDNFLTGLLIDMGTDVIVIYDGEHYIYIPLIHIHFIHFNYDEEYEIQKPTSDAPIGDKEKSLSLRKILNNAKGIFSEVFVTSNQSIHGYVTNVLNDYFVFFSPVYKELFIPLQHLKWLIPYNPDQRPYNLNNESFLLTPSSIPLARTFTQQCKKYVGRIVIFDLGNHPNKIGKLVAVEDGQLELVVARNHTIYVNPLHIKTVHLP